jgi:hypothetical protein
LAGEKWNSLNDNEKQIFKARGLIQKQKYTNSNKAEIYKKNKSPCNNVATHTISKQTAVKNKEIKSSKDNYNDKYEN